MTNEKVFLELTQDGEKLIIDSPYEPEINFEANDNLVFALPEITRYEMKSRVEGSDFGGASVTVLGVRLFGGSSKKRREEKLVPIDTGPLILTRKKIYFLGNKDTMIIPINKVLQVETYEDGLGIRRHDRQTVQYFEWDEEASIKLTGVEGVEDGSIIPLNGSYLAQLIEGVMKEAFAD